MNYDLVAKNSIYRGIDRGLDTSVFFHKAPSKYYYLMDEYFKYIDCTIVQEYEENDKHPFDITLDLYHLLVKNNIPCEVIAYDIAPIDSIFGYPLCFLGLDIVHDMCESIISDIADQQISRLLNKNGLCSNLRDVKLILACVNQGNVQWTPCYVYKVMLQS